MIARAKTLLAKLRAWWTKDRRRVKTPTVLQMEAVECGAASLGIILAYLGRWVPLEELRSACGVSRDGSKASNMLKAARSYGLEAKGFKTEPAGLRKFEPPLILHWNFNHFLVLEGFDRERVYLNDPGSGPRTVSHQELDESFTGVVLQFKRGEAFQAEGTPPSLIPALARRLRGSTAALVFVLLAGLALVLPTLVTPAFSRVFIDAVLLDARLSWVKPLLLAMTLTALMLAALTWLQQNYLLRLETRVAVTGSGRFLWHVLRLPIEFFTQRFAGDISSRVIINDRVAQLLSRDLARNFLGCLMIFFFLLVLLRYDVLLTLVGLAVVSLNVAALRFVSRKRVDGNRRLLMDKGKMHGTAIGGLQMIETLKATGGEDDLYHRWSGYQAKVVNTRQELEQYTQYLDAVPPLLGALNTAAILGLGSLRVMNGALTLGELIAFQVLMASFVAPVNQLVNLGAQLQMVEGDMNRLDDVLRYPIDEGVATTHEPPPSAEEAASTSQSAAEAAASNSVKLQGRLELRGVTFGYSRLSPPLIQDFNLVLEPGSRVALVGTSGSGKSTLAKLVTGLYAPWSGEILYDGQTRAEVDPRVLTNSMATVDQSISMFEGSVRDNLTLWDATLPQPEVVAAAKDAAIHDDIAARPGGYESKIDEGGQNFSGGQKQRLEIARALVGRPSLLVLDEATSALDPTTEEEIDRNLRRRGCTCLIIAHRLSTIRDADEILVLMDGKVAQRGTHDELVQQDGPYVHLIEEA